MSNLDYRTDRGHWYKYGTSKAGNILYSSEYAKRHAKDGIIIVVSFTVPKNPREYINCLYMLTHSLLILECSTQISIKIWDTICTSLSGSLH